MRKLHLISMVLVMLTLTMSRQGVQASTSAWAVYLWDNASRTLLRVDDSGDVRDYQLDLPASVSLSANEIAVDAAGEIVAYCLPTQDAGPTYTTQLIVMALATDTVLLDTMLEDAVVCHAGVLSDDGQVVTVGTMGNTFAWKIRVIDVETGEVIHTLTDTDPGAEIVELFDASSPQVPVLPWPTALEDDVVTFVAYPGVGMGAPFHYHTYSWDMDAGTLTAHAARGYVAGDTVPEADLTLQPRIDETFPVPNSGGQMPNYNTLWLVDAEDNDALFYHPEGMVILDSWFVADGQAVLVRVQGSYDPDTATVRDTALHLLDMEGEIIRRIAMNSDYFRAANIPDGFVAFYTMPTEQGRQQILEIHTMDGEVTPLWSYATDDEASATFWQMISLSDVD